MMRTRKGRVMRYVFFLTGCLISFGLAAQTNPLWTQQKVRNYLPHMTAPEVAALFMEPSSVAPGTMLDRHGGTGETSNSLYLMPALVQLDKAVPAELTLPRHLEEMLPEIIEGEPTTLMLFLAEGLKAEETGKKTSSAEMSTTGVWGERDPREASVERGEDINRRIISAAVKFIDRWNELAYQVRTSQH